MRDIDRDRTSSPSGRDDDRIGTLIRIAGPRPAVPRDREERVKAAVREHWRAAARDRSRRTRWRVTLAAAAVLTLAVGLGVWSRVPWPGPSQSAVVEGIAGGAWIRSNATGEAAAPARVRLGDAIPPGARLETEAGGRVAVRMASQHSVRLDGTSRVTVLSDDALVLHGGTVYVDSGGPLGAGTGPVTLSTPFGVVEDIGTQFEATVSDSSLRLRVREGSVSLTRDESAIAVTAGSELEVDVEGRTVRREIRPFDPVWSWVESIAPAIDIDGRTVSEFLTWASREGGWTVEFGDDGLKDSSHRITLSGSIEGLGVRDALDAVLPTSGMQHRVDGGVLVVETLKD